MSVETEAVAEITKIINRCQHLEGVFDTYDRVPLTDGHIDIYSSKDKSTRTLRGRVPVQIKGRTSKRKPPPSFSLKRESLEAHQKIGGVLLLCVDINLKSNTNTPQYAVLTPFDIRHKLQSIPPKQKSISIPLKKLARDPVEVGRIVDVALAGTRQNPLIHTDLHLFKSVKHITIAATDALDFTVPTRLRPGENAFALEATTDSGDIVPLDGGLEIMPADYVTHTRELRVSAGHAVYESVTLQRLSSDKVRVNLDEGLSLTIREATYRREIDISVTPQSNFAARKRAIDFTIGIVKTGSISLDDQPLSVDWANREKSAEFEELCEHQEFLVRLQELFDKFDIDSSLIDFDRLTDQNIDRLSILYNIFINDANAGNTNGEPGRMLVNVGEWAVMLLVIRGAGEGTWRYIDPFDPASPQMFWWSPEDDPAASAPVTAYDTLEVTHLLKILNLRLDAVDKAYERIAQTTNALALANKFVRDLLHCADEGGPRREEFLHGAQLLNEWIIKQESENAIHLLNRWQISWRRQELTDTHRTEIRSLKRESARAYDPVAAQKELACALLLGDAEESAYLNSQMTTEQRDEMKSWPIWELSRQMIKDCR